MWWPVITFGIWLSGRGELGVCKLSAMAGHRAGCAHALGVHGRRLWFIPSLFRLYYQDLHCWCRGIPSLLQNIVWNCWYNYYFPVNTAVGFRVLGAFNSKDLEHNHRRIQAQSLNALDIVMNVFLRLQSEVSISALGTDRDACGFRVWSITASMRKVAHSDFIESLNCHYDVFLNGNFESLHDIPCD